MDPCLRGDDEGRLATFTCLIPVFRSSDLKSAEKLPLYLLFEYNENPEIRSLCSVFVLELLAHGA